MRCDGNSGVIVRLQTDRVGLEMVLGPLELAIMQVIWDADRPPLTNKEIRQALSHTGLQLTIPTVGNTMHRLANKGYVCESRFDGLYQYAARMTEDELEVYVVEHVMRRLREAWPGPFEEELDRVLRGTEVLYHAD